MNDNQEISSSSCTQKDHNFYVSSLRYEGCTDFRATGPLGQNVLHQMWT